MTIDTWVWGWLILSGLLLAGEMFTGTFYLLFFGAASLLTALITYLAPIDLTLQILSFAGLSVIGAVVVQKKLPRNKSAGFDMDLNQTIILSTTIAAGQQATIQYQGAPWTAVNDSPRDLQKGDKARILRIEGVRLFIGPVN